jgi:tetratricopeptide (TPR) repeat protein
MIRGRTAARPGRSCSRGGEGFSRRRNASLESRSPGRGPRFTDHGPRPTAFLALLILAPLWPGEAFADRATAEAAIRDGDAALQQKNVPAAIAAYERAVEADRAWGLAWGRLGVARYRGSQFTGAIENLTIAISLDPATKDWRFWRTQTYFYLDRIQEALEDAEALHKIFPGDLDAMSLYGRAMIRAGHVDEGIALQEKAFQDANRDPQLPVRSDGYWRKGDWAKLREVTDDVVRRGAPSTVLLFHKAAACVELGDWEGAEAARAEAERRSRGVVFYMAKLAIESTPAAGARFDPKAVEADVATLLESAGSNPEAVNAAARAWFLVGRPDDCLNLLATRGRRTNFETLFWLGAAHWKKGEYAEARTVLMDARRLNPYLAKHGSRVEGIGDFLASIDRELQQEGGAGADRTRLGHELATHLLTVAEIEALVRRYRFARAVAEYERLLPALKSGARKAEVEARIPEVKGMAGALAKLVAGINRGTLKLKGRVGKTELALTKCDDSVFDFTISGGAGKFPWAFLDPALFCEFAAQAGLTPEETLGLGCLAWDAGLGDRAAAFFEEALKKKPALRAGVTAFVARRRGIPAPADGFVHWRGQYVTKEEKENLEKGLVRWEGRWVSAKDREHLAKGETLIDGKWVKGDEAALLNKGFRKHDGQWMSAEDYEALRRRWEHAWIEETAHYTVRTNESEAFARELAGLAEAAYGAFKAYYGGDEPRLPAKEKMTLFAFRTYEDYRRHCVETKAEGHLNAAGFATSDSNVVVGWNKTSNRQQFLQTMVHEAAHLYYFRVAPAARAASWHAEGMATYFEGFDWDGRGWKFGGVPEGRLPYARRAMLEGKHIPLADLLKGDALALINSDSQKALLFYAECWALNYYLSETDNKAYRAAYAEYRKDVAKGGAKELLEYFKDPAQMEKDWVLFVTGL